MERVGSKRGTGRSADLREQILQSRPEVRQLWDASQTKRDMALALVRLRQRAQLSQAQLAERAGWQKSYVSRLEAASDFFPDTETIRRYAEACGGVVSVVFTAPDASVVHVIDAVTLVPSDVHPFESMRDQDVVAIATATANTE